MKCLNCGAELQETDLFCPKCGEAVKKENINEVSEVNEVNDVNEVSEVNEVKNETNENMFTYERQPEEINEEGIQFNNTQPNNNSNKNNTQPKQTKPTGQVPKKKTNTGIIFLIVLVVIIIIVAGIAYFVKSRIKEAAQNGFLSSLFGTENILDLNEGTLEDWIYGDGNEINTTGNAMLDALMGEDGNSILDAILGGNSITTTNSTVDNSITNNSIPDTTSGNTSATTTNSNTTQVDFEGYRFNIPKNYTQTVLNGSTLKVQSTEENWIASFGIGTQNVTNYIADNSFMRSIAEQAFKKQGLTITDSATTTINGVKYVIFEAKDGGENVDFAFIDKGDNNMIYMVLMASDLNKALNSISTLVKDAQYIGK